MTKAKTTKKGGAGKRKSKAEGMTGKKAATTEVRTIKKTDNQSEMKIPEPTDYNHHFATVKGLKEKSATAASHLRHARTQAKKAGINLEALDFDLAQDRAPDPVKAQNYLEQLNLGFQRSGAPLKLSVNNTLLADTKDMAYQRGLDDAKAGRSSNNRYPIGSDLHAEYARGGRHGTAETLGVSREDADRAAEEGDGNADAFPETDESDDDLAEGDEASDIGDIPEHIDRRTPANAH